MKERERHTALVNMFTSRISYSINYNAWKGKRQYLKCFFVEIGKNFFLLTFLFRNFGA